MDRWPLPHRKKLTPTEVVEVEDVSEEITFEDFMKVDLRVATVIACEKVPKTDKLLKLQLDLQRQAQAAASI